MINEAANVLRTDEIMDEIFLLKELCDGNDVISSFLSSLDKENITTFMPYGGIAVGLVESIYKQPWFQEIYNDSSLESFNRAIKAIGSDFFRDLENFISSMQGDSPVNILTAINARDELIRRASEAFSNNQK